MDNYLGSNSMKYMKKYKQIVYLHFSVQSWEEELLRVAADRAEESREVCGDGLRSCLLFARKSSKSTPIFPCFTLMSTIRLQNI